MRDTNWKTHWEEVKTKRSAVIASGFAVVRVYRTRVQVISPLNDEFRLAALELGGRWRYRTGMWTFPLAEASKVVNAVMKAYGSSKVHDLTKPRLGSDVADDLLNYVAEAISKFQACGSCPGTDSHSRHCRACEEEAAVAIRAIREFARLRAKSTQ